MADTPPERWVVNQIDRFLSSHPFEAFTPSEVLEAVEWIDASPARQTVAGKLGELVTKGYARRHRGVRHFDPSIFWAIPPMRGDEPRIAGQEEE